jgi:hypothetical protein
MIRLFAGNQSLVLILIPIIFGLNLILFRYFPFSFLLENRGENLWGITFDSLGISVELILAMILVSANALGINYVFNAHEFYDRNTYLPSFIYVLLACFFPFSVGVTDGLIGQSFFIASIYFLVHIRQNEEAKSLLFNAGFLTGLACTFQLAFVLLIPIMWVGVFSIRTFSFREWMLSVLGFTAPFLWVWVLNPAFIDQLGELNFLEKPSALGIMSIAVFVLVILLLVLSYFGIRSRFLNSSVRFRRIMNLIAALFVFILVVNLLSVIYLNSYTYLTLGIPVLAILLPYGYFDKRWGIITRLLFYGIIVIHILKFTPL